MQKKKKYLIKKTKNKKIYNVNISLEQLNYEFLFS